MGIGERKDLSPFPGKNAPPPGSYKLFSIFDSNIRNNKGPSLGGKILYSKGDDKYKPGPGAYELKNFGKFGTIPIIVKSRYSFFYDDDIRNKKDTVSMQRYKPSYNLVEKRRFNGITFGIGDRPKMNAANNFPGPGTYNIPGNFDRGYRGKLPLN